jgi:hypothetical protein
MNQPFAVGPLLADNGFGVFTARHLPPCVDWLEIHETSPTEYVVEHSLAAPDSKRKYKIVERRKFETKESAIAARDAWGNDLLRKHEQNRAAIQAAVAKRKKRKSAEDDIETARLAVLKKQYPDTFDALAKHKNEPEHEDVRLGYACDMTRLHKASKDNLIVSGSLSLSEIEAIATARKQKSPRDIAEEEMALNWPLYSNMKPEEYASKINEKVGTAFSAGAMKKKSLRLGLTSNRPEGRPDGGNWDKRNS